MATFSSFLLVWREVFSQTPFHWVLLGWSVCGSTFLRRDRVRIQLLKMPISDLWVALPLNLHRRRDPICHNVRWGLFAPPFDFANGSKILKHPLPEDNARAVKDRLEPLRQIAVRFRESTDNLLLGRK